MILLLALILTVVILFLFKNPKNAAKSRNPPSPPGLPIIGNLHQFSDGGVHTHLYLFKLAKKYGPLMSMKLGKVHVVVVSSAKLAKEVLKTHDLAFCSRPSSAAMKKLSYGGLDIGFSPYNESWRELRKISVLHLFGKKQVQSFIPIREEEVFRMIKNIANSNSSGQEDGVNLSTVAVEYTMTLILRIAFGKQSCEVELNKRKFDYLLMEVQKMEAGLFVSDYLPLFSWVDKLTGMLSRLDKTFKEFDEFSQGLIDEHLDPNHKDKRMNPDNILDLLLQLKEQNSCSIDLTWEHIKAVLYDIFIAGTDSVESSIVWAMTALMQTPTTMKKLQAEIRETIGKKGFVNEDDLPKLPYFKAVIKETFRLYPPLPLLIPRECTEECIIGGYTIPPKTLVHVNSWAIARDPEYWKNPDEFSPERFLNSSVDVIGHDFELLPFGSGRRVCPGISMGLAAMELALANLVYSFDWELPHGLKKQGIDTEAIPGTTLHKKTPLCLVPGKYICA